MLFNGDSIISLFIHGFTPPFIDLFLHSLNQRSFKGPGGVGGGLDSLTGPKDVRGNWLLLPPVASSPPTHPPPPLTTGRTINILPEVLI